MIQLSGDADWRERFLRHFPFVKILLFRGEKFHDFTRAITLRRKLAKKISAGIEDEGARDNFHYPIMLSEKTTC